MDLHMLGSKYIVWVNFIIFLKFFIYCFILNFILIFFKLLYFDLFPIRDMIF